jgi:hypothetical protein
MREYYGKMLDDRAAGQDAYVIADDLRTSGTPT